MVSVPAPILTGSGGAAWAQAVFCPFSQVSRYGRGVVLTPEVESPVYNTRHLKAAPYLKSVAVWNEDAGGLTVFAVNRYETDAAELHLDICSFAGYAFTGQGRMAGYDRKAYNTAGNPHAVVSAEDGVTEVSGCRAVLIQLVYGQAGN